MQASDQGHLEVVITDHDGNAIREEFWCLLSENKAQFGTQFRFESKTDGAAGGGFPPGPYTLQVIAKGYAVGRAFVELQADHTHKSTVHLRKEQTRPRLSVIERLERHYGIKTTKEALQDLTVPGGRKIALDYRKSPDQANLRVLSATSLQDLKRWVGAPASAFPGDHPRFGKLPSLDGTDAERANLSSDQKAALLAGVREYIQGNPRAVSSNLLQTIQNQFSKVTGVYVPIFYFNNVTIYNGATLEIGQGSSVFVCNTLTIHPKGTLSVVGECRADVGLFVQL